MKTSDELHRARKAFETERATHPDAAARERAIGLAMQAFYRKNQTIGQEMRSGERLNQRNDNALWRRIMSHFATNRKTLMAGVAIATSAALATPAISVFLFVAKCDMIRLHSALSLRWLRRSPLRISWPMV